MPRLNETHDGQTVAVHELPGGRVKFGRSADNDLRLQGQGVSRRHGRFIRDYNDRWTIEDAGSSNGTYVDGERITRRMLAAGDHIQIGVMTFIFEDAARADTLGVTLQDIDIPRSTIAERKIDRLTLLSHDRLLAVYDIARGLLERKNTATLLDLSADLLLQHTGGDVVVIGLTRGSDIEPDQLKTLWRNPPGTGVRLSRSILRQAMEARRAVLIGDALNDTALVEAQSIVTSAIHSAMCVPLTRRDDVVGFIYIDRRSNTTPFRDEDLQFVYAIGAIVGAAVENARLAEAELEKQRLEDELASARHVQQAILPDHWPAPKGWSIAGEHLSCLEVGGDYYDAMISRDGYLWLLVADVAGKGTPAALIASLVHAYFHALVDRAESPAAMFQEMNQLLLRREQDRPFVTAAAVRIDLESGAGLLCSAGHCPLVKIEPGETPSFFQPGGDLILGVLAEATFTDTPITFARPGSGLVLYTDGVVEAFNTERQRLGDKPLLEAVEAVGSDGVQPALESVLSAVNAHRGDAPQSDDITLLACFRTG